MMVTTQQQSLYEIEIIVHVSKYRGAHGVYYN